MPMISRSFPRNTTEDQEVFTMTNDNNELKNNAPCEEKQKAREHTPDEMAKVSGGTEPSGGVKPMPTTVWMGIPRSEG